MQENKLALLSDSAVVDVFLEVKEQLTQIKDLTLICQ